MIKHIKSLLALAFDRRGVTALEYALIGGIIVAVIAVGFGVYASELSNKFIDIAAGV
jgi:Flp pilus assembly pilin Flp